MPFTRSSDVPLSLSEEATTTPRGLIKIAFLAAGAFLVMAVLVEDKAVPIFVGSLILALLVVGAAWLWFQSRYGEAVLTAKTQFIHGRRFEGEIVTGLKTVPRAPVRIHVLALHGRVATLSVREAVPPERLRTDDNGNVRIPFSFQVPDDEWARRSTGVRFYVRTRTWPIGWGATFLLVSPWGDPE